MFACIEGGLGNDPQKVADALARLEDTSLQRQAAPTLVEGWAKKDPAAAAAWVLTLPEGKTRMLALDRIGPAWVPDVTALDAGLPVYADPRSGLSVFTSEFLARRGYCCDSGCRHCPFIAD